MADTQNKTKFRRWFLAGYNPLSDQEIEDATQPPTEQEISDYTAWLNGLMVLKGLAQATEQEQGNLENG